MVYDPKKVGFELNGPGNIMMFVQMARGCIEAGDDGGLLEYLDAIENDARRTTEWLQRQNRDGVKPSITWTDFVNGKKV